MSFANVWTLANRTACNVKLRVGYRRRCFFTALVDADSELDKMNYENHDECNYSTNQQRSRDTQIRLEAGPTAGWEAGRYRDARSLVAAN